MFVPNSCECVLIQSIYIMHIHECTWPKYSLHFRRCERQRKIVPLLPLNYELCQLRVLLLIYELLNFIEYEAHIHTTDTLLYLFKVIADNLSLCSPPSLRPFILQPQVRPDRVIHVQDIAASYNTPAVKIASYRETKQTQEDVCWKTYSIAFAHFIMLLVLHDLHLVCLDTS